MSVAEISTVREQLWLLGHDERFDILRPRLNIGALEIGLMAATLIDLLFGGHIRVIHGMVRPDEPARTHHRGGRVELDPITAGILEAITAERATPLGELLRATRADLPADVHHPYVRLYQRTLAALQAAGLVVQRRRTFFSPLVRLSDPDSLAWIPRQITQRMVYLDRASDPQVDGLCALVWGLGMHTLLITPFDPAGADEVMRQIIGAIPRRAGPQSPLVVVPHLARCVRNAVGDLATAAF